MYSNKFYGNVKNSANLLIDRQYGRNLSYVVSRRLQNASQFIDRLELESSLDGHNGCVNCLEWSTDGSILASGSDDYHVMLWDPFSQKNIFSLKTPHNGNIFSVKFLPKSGNALIATGAADKRINVFDVNRKNNDPIWKCGCHFGRVKRLATAPDMPYVFWSGAEDGNVLQFDIREPHHNTDKAHLIQVPSTSIAPSEVKCIAINPMQTDYIAVGANDAYARVYDRRMLQLKEFAQNSLFLDDTIPRDCVTYYCPGHISQSKSNITDSRAITYLAYNPTGTELLVNVGGDHIYLYDLQKAGIPQLLDLPEYTDAPADDDSPSEHSHSHPKRKLPEHVESYKKMGNEFLENEKYLRAIDQYSAAIAVAPQCPVFYLNRATAYMRRLWYGDVYAALRDCQQALQIDPSYVKAHFRLARALLDLGYPEEAASCLDELVNRFPNYTNNHGVLMLRKDIEAPKKPPNRLNCPTLSAAEEKWRQDAKDYKERFVGHCNTTTDIKEANFLGNDFIVAGSDDGNFFIWERGTTKIRSIYRADMAIVNCVQPHPDICMLATSGIDHVIKIWSPAAVTVDEKNSNRISYTDSVVEANQQRMQTDVHEINGPLCVSS